MAGFSIFSKRPQAKLAPSTNPQQPQRLAPSGSWAGFVLALIASGALIFSAGVQNVAYGYALGAATSEFRGVVLALASGGATLMAPLAFAAAAVAFRRRQWGTSLAALVLGSGALLYAMTCSLGFVGGSREIAADGHAMALQGHADRRALADAARKELAGLKGQRSSIVERRAELMDVLVDLSKAKPGDRPSARPDAQAAGVAFVLGAFGWRVAVADVGRWLTVGTVAFLEFAASLSLTVAAALYPVRVNVAATESPRNRETKSPRKPGRRPINGKAMSATERSRRFREKQGSGFSLLQ